MSYADQNLKDIYQYHSNFERSERVYLAKKVAIMSILLIGGEWTWGLPRIILIPVKPAGQ